MSNLDSILKSRDTPEGRQYGQRIGQIVQSDDEQKRQYYIDKLKNAGNK